MIQSSLLANIAASMSTRWRGTSLTWKITGAFLGTLLVFGILVITIVYILTRGLLYEQINKRTLALATNLSDAVAGQIQTKDLLALHAMVGKYALQEGVAYAFIEDRNGRILAHSLGGKFPAELQTEAILGESWQTARRNLIFRSRPVYETSIPILGGRSGVAHVIMWGDVVEAEIQRALASIIGLIGLLLLVGAIISLRLSRQIVRPIIRLRSMADTMSKGNLDSPVGVDSGDEIGELALSIERMRTSLKAAMMRLRRANLGSPLIHDEGEKKMNKPRHKQPRCSLLLVSAAILTLAVCYSSTVFSADKQDKIRVAYSSISGNTASLWVAYEHGFFRKHGLNVELVFIEGGSTTVQTLISGDVAIAQMAGSAAIQSNLRGADVVLIAGLINTLTFQVIVEKGISQPDLFKGKSIGVTRFGSSTDFAARYALDKWGLTPQREVTIVELGSMPSLLSALASGKIQGAMLSAPFTLHAKKSGFSALADLQMLGLEYQHTAIAASQTLIKSKPDLVRNFMKAYVEGIHFYKTHRKEALAVMAKYLKTNDTEALNETYETIGLALLPEKPYPTPKGIQIILQELAAKDPKAQAAKPEQFVDLSFIKELDNSGFINRLYKPGPAIASRETTRPSFAANAKGKSPGEDKTKIALPLAPVGETKNKLITASANDVSPKTASVATTAVEEYTVKAGDHLSKLAAQFYGAQWKWEKIYEANRRTMRNPHSLYIGQRLVIPPETRVRT